MENDLQLRGSYESLPPCILFVLNAVREVEYVCACVYMYACVCACAVILFILNAVCVSEKECVCVCG